MTIGSSMCTLKSSLVFGSVNDFLHTSVDVQELYKRIVRRIPCHTKVRYISRKKTCQKVEAPEFSTHVELCL